MYKSGTTKTVKLLLWLSFIFSTLSIKTAESYGTFELKPCFQKSPLFDKQLQALGITPKNLGSQDRHGKTHLMKAIKTRNTDLVRYLCAHSQRANIDAHSKKGITALMMAACDTQQGKLYTDLLISAGALVNLTNARKNLPALAYAARSQNVPIVEALLLAGAASSHQTLMCAITGGNSKIVELLVQKGNYFKISDHPLKTYYDLAIRLYPPQSRYEDKLEALLEALGVEYCGICLLHTTFPSVIIHKVKTSTYEKEIPHKTCLGCAQILVNKRAIQFINCPFCREIISINPIQDQIKELQLTAQNLQEPSIAPRRSFFYRLCCFPHSINPES